MTWVLANLPLLGQYTLAHLTQAVPAIIATFLLAVPAARLARLSRPVRSLLVTGSSLLYAIPSLALFIVLPLIIGTGVRDTLNVIVALTLYGLALMVPAAVEALESVDRGPLAAATAMGMGIERRFLTVELPLAGPALLAGLRVVTVSTISLTTVGAVLGVRSLGFLFTDGFQRGLWSEVLSGLVLTVALALILDLLVVAVGRLLMPWTRRRRPSNTGGETEEAAA
ncbi:MULTISPECIES: ABC transporter permease [Actinomyces]|uniref:ABC transporter permease subunit n=1 Tax=Actinomyces respiraculi TaxID=2744574 RepID=A0A7T0PWS2_9ACTO|nr:MULTISPECIES: ABC transporter permease subunit [Actinomyces]QPL06024.1 ABC transporter permease subunit [Actinomyces respiraculi]